jgi:Uma2 family endonuclease
MAPDIAVEILSPDDRRADVDAKRRDYLAAGTALVIIVDPDARAVRTHEADGTERTFTENDTLTAAPFPDLAIPLAPIFARVKRNRD